MGRKKKESGESIKTKLSPFKNLKEETMQGVLAVVFFVFGIFFILAAFDKAGIVGEKLYGFPDNPGVLRMLFGYGYFLLPMVSIMLCVSYFQSLKREVGGSQAAGGTLFLLSALGVLHLISNNTGGLVGKWVANPLISLIDIYASAFVLVALVVISFLVMFDTALRIDFLFALKGLFSKKKALELERAPLTPPIEPPRKLEIPVVEETEKIGIMQRALDGVKSSATKEKDEDFIPLKPRTISLRPFTPPPLSIVEKDRGKPETGDIKANANIIKRTLQNFGIAVEMDEVSIGPSVTRFALKPAEGVKLSRILGLQNNLELALAAHPVRIEAPIPGKSLVGIEIPNTTKTTVGLGTILAESGFQNSDKPLLVALGKDISGSAHFANVAKMPHLLIAGATGSGKSVTIHAVIASLLFRNPPETLKFIMIDPKRVELTLYNKIPHLLTPVITDAKKAIQVLKWAAKEMDRRYDVLGSHSVRDLDSYHKTILEPELKRAREQGGLKEGEEIPESMPYIVVVIDELADIMQAYPRELESAIVRLAQMSRAVGIHLILSTQRPSVNVITGLIKANVPSRLALQVASQIDSRTILDTAGAEKLLGAGDMLYMSGDMSKPTRIQSAYITEGEVKKLVKYLAEHYESDPPSEIDFSLENLKNATFESSFGDDENADDDLYEDAREEVMRANKASTSYLQRKFGIGYARAARIIDMLEERGVVGPGSGSKPREVLAPHESTTGSGEVEST